MKVHPSQSLAAKSSMFCSPSLTGRLLGTPNRSYISGVVAIINHATNCFQYMKVFKPETPPT